MVAPLLLALKIQLALITTLRINCKTEDPLKSLYPNLSKCVHFVNPHLVIIIFIKYKKVELFHACKQLDLKLYKSTGDKINRFDWKKQNKL